MSGAVVWLTGLPRAGKSTLAAAVAERARAEGLCTIVLDGDAIRGALSPSPGYDDAGRDALYETLARLAALIAEQGVLAIVAATAHRAAYRERARSLSPRWIEVLVDTPPDVCRRRDTQGLYRHPRTPGNELARYERPRAPSLVVRPDDADAAGAILARVRQAPETAPTRPFVAPARTT